MKAEQANEYGTNEDGKAGGSDSWDEEAHERRDRIEQTRG